MNEFLFFLTLCVSVLVCVLIWCGAKELFTRWLRNDWCKHDWGMWGAVGENNAQLRFCKKCNKAERQLT